MLKIKDITFLIFLLFLFSTLYAQQDYKKWLKEEQKKFQEFKDARDKAFVEFLKKEWQAFELFKGLVPDETPKPVNIPVTTTKEIPADIQSKKIKEIQLPKPPIIKESESIEKFISKFLKKEEPLTFSFFDVSLKVNYDKTILKANLKNPINEKQISDFWADLSRTNYEDLLDQSKKLKEQMKLNDWGYCLLLSNIGKGLYSNFENKIKLFVWFMLAKAGYDARVGYEKDELFLLLPSKHVIYGTKYLDLDKRRYYVVTFNGERKKVRAVYTYDGSYPDAQELIGLNIKSSPVIGQVIADKKLKFRYGDEEFSVSLRVKKDVIDFYNNYPQTDYKVYFDASLSPEARYSLLQNLKPIIEGKSEAEAVNILLRFVQTAFEYKKDDIQFGREKPFFAEETLFYPYSDCEDRSVLFSYLVRNLIGLEVIGLDYPGHIATAVKFSTEIKGDIIKNNKKEYLVCDPTYINANIGQCMTRFKNVEPKVISIGIN